MPRVNTRQTFAAWQAGKPARPAPSIRTNGHAITSYATEIARRLSSGSIAILTAKFSVTTTNHQNGLRYLATEAGIPVQEYATRLDYERATDDDYVAHRLATGAVTIKAARRED